MRTYDDDTWGLHEYILVIPDEIKDPFYVFSHSFIVGIGWYSLVLDLSDGIVSIHCREEGCVVLGVIHPRQPRDFQEPLERFPRSESLWRDSPEAKVGFQL